MFFCCSLVVYSQNNDSITSEILLDYELLKESSIDAEFINSIEYSPNEFILLSSPTQFYLLGMGGMIPIFESWTGKSDIESFTVKADGILLIASGNALYQAYTEPSFIKIMDIPDNDMGVTSKYKDIYVFDRILKNNKKNYSIYQISENKEITSLVTMPTPILSVFEQPTFLIFSTINLLFSIDIHTRNMFQILALPKENDIISVVGDTINRAVYFSTDSAIYRIKDNKIEIISEDFGGTLRYDGEGLLIFNSGKKLIIRLRNTLLYPVSNNVKKD